MGGMGCFMISFVICVECVGVKYTMLVGIIIEIPFAIGELLLGLEAYYLRDFFPLQLVKKCHFVCFNTVLRRLVAWIRSSLLLKKQWLEHHYLSEHGCYYVREF
jgi:hypothetical protein